MEKKTWYSLVGGRRKAKGENLFASSGDTKGQGTMQRMLERNEMVFDENNSRSLKVHQEKTLQNNKYDFNSGQQKKNKSYYIIRVFSFATYLALLYIYMYIKTSLLSNVLCLSRKNDKLGEKK